MNRIKKLLIVLTTISLCSVFIIQVMEEDEEEIITKSKTRIETFSLKKAIIQLQSIIDSFKPLKRLQELKQLPTKETSYLSGLPYELVTKIMQPKEATVAHKLDLFYYNSSEIQRIIKQIVDFLNENISQLEKVKQLPESIQSRIKMLLRVSNIPKKPEITNYKQLNTNNKTVHSLVFSHTKIAASISSKKIILWDINSFKQTNKLDLNTKYPSYSIDFSPNGDLLAAATLENNIKIWSLKNLSVVFTITCKPESKIVAFGINKKILGVSLHDGSTVIIDPENKNNQPQVQDKSGKEATTIAFSPNGKTLAIGYNNGMLLLKNLNTKTQKTIQKHEDTITSIAFSPNETIFATASSDATIKIWDYKTTNVKNTVTLEEQTGISKILISFNPQGTVLAIGYDETLLFLNPTTGMQIKEVFLIPDDLYNEIDIQSIAFSPDGNTLAVGTDSNNIILLEIPTIEKVILEKQQKDIKARQTRWKQEQKKRLNQQEEELKQKNVKKNRQKALQKKLWEKEKDEDVVIQQSGQPQSSTQAITQPQPIQKTWWQKQWARYTPKRIQRWFKTKSTIKALGIGGTAATIGALYYFRKPIGKTIYKWIKR